MPRLGSIAWMSLALACLVAIPSGDASAATARTSDAPARPVIQSVTPGKSVVGDELLIRGRNFVPGRKRNTVFFKAYRGAAIAAVARTATRRTLRVTIPRSLERRMLGRRGSRQATRFRLRVRSRRLSGRFTPLRLSPLIFAEQAPPEASPALARPGEPCSGAACLPGREPIGSAPATKAPAPPGGLVFEDHFDGPAVNTAHWSPYNSAGHAGNGLRRPSAFAQVNGQLVITAAWDGSNIVSGGMSHRYDQLYGSYEFRVRVDPDPTGQLSGVVLTWPQSGRQVPDGEMDMWETGHSAAGRNPWKTFIHRSQDGVSDSQVWLTHNSDASQWHTVRMDWTAHAIRIYVDGALDGQITDPARIPAAPHHVAVQLDAFSNRPLAAPVRMYVDWLKVYRQM